MARTGGKSGGRVAVFMSYVHDDDRDDEERITKWFYEALKKEVNVHLSPKIEFFFDRESIKGGQNWQRRLKESVESVNVFMPIITAGYFAHDWCTRELGWF